MSRRAPVPPPGQRLSIFWHARFCHPDQASEAQAEANAWRDQREAMCLENARKKRNRSALVPPLRSRKNASSARDDGEVPLKRKIDSPGQGRIGCFCGHLSLFSQHIPARIHFAKSESRLAGSRVRPERCAVKVELLHQPLAMGHRGPDADAEDVRDFLVAAPQRDQSQHLLLTISSASRPPTGGPLAPQSHWRRPPSPLLLVQTYLSVPPEPAALHLSVSTYVADSTSQLVDS